MLTNKEKAELVVSVSDSQVTPAIQNLLKLIDLLIEEARIDNDLAGSDTVKRNQGGIALLLILKEYITKGLPSSNR